MYRKKSTIFYSFAIIISLLSPTAKPMEKLIKNISSDIEKTNKVVDSNEEFSKLELEKIHKNIKLVSKKKVAYQSRFRIESNTPFAITKTTTKEDIQSLEIIEEILEELNGLIKQFVTICASDHSDTSLEVKRLKNKLEKITPIVSKSRKYSYLITLKEKIFSLISNLNKKYNHPYKQTEEPMAHPTRCTGNPGFCPCFTCYQLVDVSCNENKLDPWL